MLNIQTPRSIMSLSYHNNLKYILILLWPQDHWWHRPYWLNQVVCLWIANSEDRILIGRLLKSMFTKCLGFFREHVHSCHQTPHDLTTCCLNWWWWWWWWWWGLIVKCVKLIDWRIRWFPSKPSTYAPPYSVNTKFWSEAAKKKLTILIFNL